MKKLVTEGDHPNWLTQGRTVLVPKNSQQSQMSSNYQSITCLSTTCKFLSGILADKIGVHMEREKRSAQHRKCWAPQKVESKILCQQETRSDQLMDECKRLMTTWKNSDKAAAWYKKPLNGAWHQAVSEFADIFHTYQWLKKATSNQTLGLWSLQLKSRPSTPGQSHTRSTTLCKIQEKVV